MQEKRKVRRKIARIKWSGTQRERQRIVGIRTGEFVILKAEWIADIVISSIYNTISQWVKEKNVLSIVISFLWKVHRRGEGEGKWIDRLYSRTIYVYNYRCILYICMYKSLVGFSASNNKYDDDARRDECKANQSIGTQVHTRTHAHPVSLLLNLHHHCACSYHSFSFPFLSFTHTQTHLRFTCISQAIYVQNGEYV